jgi:hypothetical protein
MLPPSIPPVLLCALAVGCATPNRSLPTTPTMSADLRQASCIGPTDARAFAVYLHGMDSPSVSDQELGNRQALAEIAEKLSLRLALPRSARRCSESTLCWGWGSAAPEELEPTFVTIEAAARACFGDRPFGLIGFSNGGYNLTAMFRTCQVRTRLPGAKGWVVTVGSTMIRGPLEPEPEDLSGCGELVMLVGEGDVHNFDPVHNYLRRLQAKRARVRLETFQGGHWVPPEPTGSVLRALISSGED